MTTTGYKLHYRRLASEIYSVRLPSSGPIGSVNHAPVGWCAVLPDGIILSARHKTRREAAEALLSAWLAGRET